MLASVPATGESVQYAHLDRREQDGAVISVDAANVCDLADDDQGDHGGVTWQLADSSARTAASLIGDGLERAQKRVRSGRGSHQLERGGNCKIKLSA